MPLPWTGVPPGPHDVGLVVCDMDGTLLTSDDAIPDAFWPLLERLRERGATFVPASGRQYATLARSFASAEADLAYVAENGSLVVHDGEVVSKTTVEPELVRQVTAALRAAPDAPDLAVVVCGVESAYIERRDPAFVTETEKYYARLQVVDDLTAMRDEVLKIAVFVFGRPSGWPPPPSPPSRGPTRWWCRASTGSTSCTQRSTRAAPCGRCRRRSACRRSARWCSPTTSTTSRCWTRRPGRSPWPTRTPPCASAPATSRPPTTSTAS